jgi:hypothetical protein
MSVEDEKQLELEVKHIFDSGANEIRIVEMVKLFIDKRYFTKEQVDEFCNDAYQAAHSNIKYM